MLENCAFGGRVCTLQCTWWSDISIDHTRHVVHVSVQSARALQGQVPFRAEPSEVLFQAHEQGQLYHQSVTFHNTTQLGQRLRLLSPLSPYFSFSGLEFFHSPEQGLVAPGMHVGVTVSFFPDALHDYDDSMIIETGQGRLEVPLRARRDPPCLDLPQQMVVGPTLRANKQVKLLASCQAYICLLPPIVMHNRGSSQKQSRLLQGKMGTGGGDGESGVGGGGAGQGWKGRCGVGRAGTLASHGHDHPTSTGTAPAPTPPPPPTLPLPPMPRCPN